MDPEDLRYNDLINDLCSYHEEELKKDFIEKCQSSNQSLLDGSKEQFEIEFQTWLWQQIAYAYSL